MGHNGIGVAVDQTTRWEVGSLVVSGAALIGTVVAIRRGASAHRWGPVAVFAALWVACALYVALASLAARRRAFRLRTFSAPLGVVLRQPAWLLARTLAEIIGFGVVLAVAVAAFGFPAVAAGLLLPVAGTAVFSVLPIIREPAALTFEDECLRVHVSKNTTFVVQWRSVVEVGQTGPAHHRPVNVRVVDPSRTIASVEPNTARNRGRVHTRFELGEPRGQAISLEPWTAGLDSDTLVRLIRSAIGARESAIN